MWNRDRQTETVAGRTQDLHQESGELELGPMIEPGG